jgi:hypothetical protein
VASTVPLWVAVALSIAPSVVALAAIIAADLSNRRSLKAARETQQREHEERLMSKLREERLRAYATFARLTKTVEDERGDPSPMLARAEAHSEIEMLTDNPKLKTVADAILQLWIEVWQLVKGAREDGVADPYAEPGIREKWAHLDSDRNTFIRLAKDEVQLKPPSRPQEPA